jgi:hypothetical protein
MPASPYASPSDELGKTGIGAAAEATRRAIRESSAGTERALRGQVTPAAAPPPPPPPPPPQVAAATQEDDYNFRRQRQQMATAPLSGGAGITPPLWLTAPDDTHLKVQFGQVNGITPSAGWAGGGDDVGVSVDASGWSDGTYNIYADATLGSDGVPTAVKVTKSTSAVPSNSSTHAYRLIGTAVLASGVVGAVSPSMAWSQEFVTCGRDAADPTTTPGTYFWELA